MPVTACPLDCPDTCSLEVTVEAGRITKIDAAPGNPLTQGFICQKVKHHAERVYGPDRVLTPLVRRGPKGSGSFEAASWDDALDLVAGRIREAIAATGPGSVVPLVYNSSAGVLASAALTDRLFGRLGAAEVQETICAATAGAAWDLVFGGMHSADPHDVVHARHVVVWGANPAVSNTHLPPLVQQARAAGAHLTVIDPRRTAMAARADRHLALLPGTDVVLALAVARHLRAEGLLAEAFLARHASGVDEHLAAAEPWTLDRAADVCGVPSHAIASFAEAYAGLRPSFLRVGWGVERNRNGGAGFRAVLALAVLAGHFGVLGSGLMTSLSDAAPLSMRRADPDARAPRPERRQLNMNHIGRLLCGELDGPPARVLFVSGANPAVMAPDQQRVLRGLAREDLFTVVHDQVLTDTAALADVVLPCTTHFEADDITHSYGSFTLQRMPRLIDPVGESRTNDEVASALAQRLGLPAASFDPDPVVMLERIVLDGGGAEGARVLRAPGTTVQFADVFPTFADRRARLHDPSGQVPAPAYRPLDSPYPLALVTPASSRTINSILGEVRPAEAVVTMSAADASPRGVADGDVVRLWNDQAAIELPCRIDTGLRAGVVVMPKGLWRRHLPGGLTANAFTPDTINDLAGGACFNDARVEATLVAARGSAEPT